MVKEEEGCSSCGAIERWHGFDPFGKIVEKHDNILVIIRKWVLTLHKVNSPFTERNVPKLPLTKEFPKFPLN